MATLKIIAHRSKKEFILSDEPLTLIFNPDINGKGTCSFSASTGINLIEKYLKKGVYPTKEIKRDKLLQK